MTCAICNSEFAARRNAKYCSDECKKAGLRQSKRRWEQRNRDRRNEQNRRYADRHKHPCADCNKPVQQNSVRCLECGLAHRAAQRDAKRQRIAGMWVEGFSMREIADDLGIKATSLGVEFARMRKLGWDLPLRRPRIRQQVGTKAQCRDQFHNAIENGTMRRPTRCEGCGKRGHVDGHHIDYSRPLYVEWLCRSCHIRLHVEQRRVAA